MRETICDGEVLYPRLRRRAHFAAVRATICDGEVLYRDGRFTRFDRDAALKALREPFYRQGSRV